MYCLQRNALWPPTPLSVTTRATASWACLTAGTSVRQPITTCSLKLPTPPLTLSAPPGKLQGGRRSLRTPQESLRSEPPPPRRPFELSGNSFTGQLRPTVTRRI